MLNETAFADKLLREPSWLPDQFKDNAHRGWRIVDSYGRGWRIQMRDGWWYEKWDHENDWHRYYPATLD